MERQAGGWRVVAAAYDVEGRSVPTSLDDYEGDTRLGDGGLATIFHDGLTGLSADGTVVVLISTGGSALVGAPEALLIDLANELLNSYHDRC